MGVFSPHTNSSSEENWNRSGDVALLSPNLTLTSLTTGRLPTDGDRDVVVMGTETLLIVYDVVENADKLYKEVEDGVYSLVIGGPLVYVGGNCSLQGFDIDGNEEYWTVTGDNVTALELCDVEGDGIPELLVGSEDYEIRIYKDDEVISEITESAEIVALTAVQNFAYAYALKDGSIGVYRRTTRLWRESTGLRPTAQAVFDLDMDGQVEVATGFADGTLQIRKQENGTLLYSEKLDDGIAALLVHDFRKEGSPQLIAVTVGGAVRGFRAEDVSGTGARALAQIRGEDVSSLPVGNSLKPRLGFADDPDAPPEAAAAAAAAATASASASASAAHAAGINGDGSLSVEAMAAARASAILGTNPLQAKLDALMEEKHRLTNALHASTANMSRLKSSDARPDEELIPHETTLSVSLVPSYQTSSIRLVISTSNETIITAVVLEADHLFDEQTLLVHPDEPSPSLEIALLPKRDKEQYIQITSLVGHRGASFFHVFEDSIRFPRFAIYLPVEKSAVVIPEAGVVVRIAESETRLYSWLRSRFLFQGLNVEASGLDIAFSSLRDKSVLGFQYFADRGLLHIKALSIDLVGDLIQDMAEFLGLSQVSSQAEFPQLMDAFSSTLAEVKAFHSTRQKLSTDMAETSNLAKTLVVKAEDARVLGDMASMRQAYSSLASLNRDLITEFTKRKNNHDALLQRLRSVHQMIQRAAKLRRGDPAKRVIAACRHALADSNMPALINAICAGE